MPRNLILHIGPMKTGSTSIQHWIHYRAPALAERGFYIPTSLGGRNHSRLALMAQSRAVGKDLSPADETRLVDLHAEIEGLDPSMHSVILSGEMMGHTLKERGEVEALKALFGVMFDDYAIVVYLRRQDELSLSRYSTALRRGDKRARPLVQPVDYELLLDNWSAVFGRHSLRPRMFSQASLVGGDAVQDFADAVGLPYEAGGERPIDRNPSLLPKAQTFLADLAQIVREHGYEGQFSNVDRLNDINHILDQHFAGKGVQPKRSDVIAFYDQVRDSNERVRKAWFPERETLFNEDFSRYPIDPEPDPRPRDRLEVAMTVLAGLITPKPGEAGTEREEDHAALAEIRREKRRLKRLEEQQGKRPRDNPPRGPRQAARRIERQRSM